MTRTKLLAITGAVVALALLAAFAVPAPEPPPKPPSGMTAEQGERFMEWLRSGCEDPGCYNGTKLPNAKGEYEFTDAEWKQAEEDLAAYRKEMGLPPLPPGRKP